MTTADGKHAISEVDHRRVLDQIDIWRKQLINLARSNRLLYFRPTRTSTLEIVDPEYPVSEVVGRLLDGQVWSFRLPDPDGPTEVDDESIDRQEGPSGAADLPRLLTNKSTAGDLQASLRALDRRATQEFMDKGIWILYLAAGLLHWRDLDTEEEADSPFVLIPVRVHRENPRAPFTFRRNEEEDIVLNPALALRLAELGVELPSIDLDDFDYRAAVAALATAIGTRNGWSVNERLIISPFSFHKEVMFRDLLDNEQAVADHAVVQALALGAGDRLALDFDVLPEERLDDLVPPERLITILDADATQTACIAAAIAGHSFVMDGPPGTGKSQTITNMIAALLARGKSVLFVSEKAAALEVVQKRLRAAGLSDYCLELHSQKASRKEVAQELGRALGLHPRQPRSMSDTDLHQLTRRRRELSERATAMNEVRQPLARTLHDVLGRIAALQGLPQAPPPATLGMNFSDSELTDAVTAAEELASVWGPVERGSDFLWRELVDASLDSARVQRIQSGIDTAIAALDDLERYGEDITVTLLLRTPADFASAEWLLRVLEQLAHRPAGVLRNWLETDDLAPLVDRFEDRREQALRYEYAEKKLLEVAGSQWRSIDPGMHHEIDATLGLLHQLDPTVDVGSLTSADLIELAEFLAASADVVVASAQDASMIAERFGIPSAGLPVGRMLEVADLAMLSGARLKPEPSWLTTTALGAVGEAIRTLEPLCAAYANQRNALASVFTDSVLELDLDGLMIRFDSVHKGLAKLGSRYRADRRTLASTTSLGKVTKDAVALLPRAAEWKRTAQQLRLEERRNSEVLGAYYASSDTDFPSVSAALEVARTALNLGGRHLNTGLAVQHLAKGQGSDPELLPAADRIHAGLDPWTGRATTLLGDAASRLMSLTAEEINAWCPRAAVVVEKLASLARDVDSTLEAGLSLDDLLLVLSARSELDLVEKSLHANEADDRVSFGATYQLLDTTWDDLEGALTWAVETRRALGGQSSASSSQRLVEAAVGPEELTRGLNSWLAARNVVLAAFVAARADELRADLSLTFEDARELLDALRRTTADIDEWVRYERAGSSLRAQHLEDVLEFCVARAVPAHQVPGIIERACLECWADALLESDADRLSQVGSEQLDRLLGGFRQLDREVVERATSSVVAACNARRPQTTIGAVGTIRREAEKLRRHMPVRRLLEATGTVAQDLKPCFMMSPLTVSQFLPSGLHFDAVIFDEASQVRPSDAANCIYRGDQLIIAGDDRQLPPTSFFETVSVDADDEYQEEQFEEYESIIKLGKAGGLRELPLHWHYRSQHESLIAYSNFGFYDGKLITFPGAIDESEDLGVKLFEVPDGIYRRGTARDNPREADVVVSRVLHWAEEAMRRPHGAATLGVVAFSEAQATAIEVALERRRREHPELDPFFEEDRLDGFFVKNLENVQGDERDIMIFSIGYGRDEQGRLTMNFGPLNRQGGERRLNVAITRARRRVEMVSSITGTEVEFGTNLADGPRHLQRYLDFAVRGSLALAIELSESGLDAESPFEEEVIRVIRSWGYEVQPQVGTAGYRVDIGVRHPDKSGQFALGVECDGRMYHSSLVARDRDRLRQQVLENLGWRIHRIWGTAWYRYREREEARLREEIQAAIRGDVRVQAGRSTLENPGATNREEFDAVPLDAPPTWTVPYRVAEPTRPRPVIQMHLPEAQADLRRMIVEVATVEGPIHDELLLRRIREAWGVGRSGDRIRDAFERALITLTRRHEVERSEDRFTYTGREQLGVVRVHGEGDIGRRTAAQISLGERASAVHQLVTEARRVERDELTFAVCRLFGWNRRGSDIASALDQAVDALVRQGLLIEEGPVLRIP